MAACCEKLAAGNQTEQKMQVKAAGGIRTLADAVIMLEAGASRLGTSGSVWIAKEAKEKVERKGSMPGTAEVKNDRPGLQTRLFTDY
jgi:deoxyribose-phosphate aldolase